MLYWLSYKRGHLDSTLTMKWMSNVHSNVKHVSLERQQDHSCTPVYRVSNIREHTMNTLWKKSYSLLTRTQNSSIQCTFEITMACEFLSMARKEEKSCSHTFIVGWVLSFKLKYFTDTPASSDIGLIYQVDFRSKSTWKGLL